MTSPPMRSCRPSPSCCPSVPTSRGSQRSRPCRSTRNSQLAFTWIGPDYPANARAAEGGHVVIAGRNYGQACSREHAVIAPRYLGLKAVIAVSFARIHWQNLANFGIVPLEFDDPADL